MHMNLSHGTAIYDFINAVNLYKVGQKTATSRLDIQSKSMWKTVGDAKHGRLTGMGDV